MRKVLIAAIGALLLLSGCATNPVTGKTELQFVSEPQEIAMGAQAYEPSQQMQGGEYVIDPEVGQYVASVGQRLAAVSDRPLPYEFVVLNNSIPNAWALPGGKIAVNRGLLLEMGSEAELAAVLGHEIVHAAARHGAKSVERGTLTQAALIGLQLSTRDNDYAGVIAQGAQLGAVLLTQKYGRNAELESDYYGMQYMARAGYDPKAAIDLQKTFVRLSEGRSNDWLSGLFASHPPSQARVEANEQTAAELNVDGEIGRERYHQALAPLKRNQPAYEAYDKGIEAIKKGDAAKAESLAREALSIEPREAKFHALLGDAAMHRKQVPDAIGHYTAAIERNPGYFRPVLKRGLALDSVGEIERAAVDLERSIELLPTAPAFYTLGNIASRRGQRSRAIELYRQAASSDSDVGRAATVELVRLDLANNPEQYIRTRVGADDKGAVLIAVANATPAVIADIQLEVVVLDPTGRQIVAREPLRLHGRLGPNEQEVLRTGLGPVSDASQLNRVRVQVRGARVLD